MNSVFKEFLLKAFARNATDIHLKKNGDARLRISRHLDLYEDCTYPGAKIEILCKEILSESELEQYKKNRYVKGIYRVDEKLQIRFCFSFDRGKPYLAIRLLPTKIRSWETLQVPNIALNFLRQKQGLILISGAIGSGKSSTIASFVEFLNVNRKEHIIYIDELIEFKVKSKDCIVNLRELGKDTQSYDSALRYALREDPDIIVIGELTDSKSIEFALDIAETGHLVIAGVSTIGCLNTIFRVLNSFSSQEAENSRLRLASYLIGVISQVMVPDLQGINNVPIFEALTMSNAISNSIRSDKQNQLRAEVSRSIKGVSITFEDYAKALQSKGIIGKNIDLGRRE
ncbi:Flp pilus assembly complex ATPase component TadA [bacterium]|nr:Flp pilus assembly complex ATPase component TadA [bacterium]